MRTLFVLSYALLTRADLALLEAKRRGRDYIVHWSASLAAKPVPHRTPRPAATPGP